MALSQQALGILIAIAVVLLTAVVLFLWRRRRGARSGVLLVGLNESGKTLLFSRLVHNKFVETYTSVKENVGQASFGSGSTLKIVDIPGHERVRAKFFDQHKNDARAVAFLVDSANLQKDIRDVAEYLYTLLTDPVVYSASPNFAIICNKQDQTMAKSSTVVKKFLEQELNTLRKTKTNRLASDESDRQISLGRDGADFKFEDLDSIQVDFLESSLTDSSEEANADVDQVQEWLESVAA